MMIINNLLQIKNNKIPKRANWSYGQFKIKKIFTTK